jgi:hypothetical protein
VLVQHQYNPWWVYGILHVQKDFICQRCAMRNAHRKVCTAHSQNTRHSMQECSVLPQTSARNGPVYHTGTSFCSWIAYWHLSICTTSTSLFPLIWHYILVSLLRSIQALLNFHFEHCPRLQGSSSHKQLHLVRTQDLLYRSPVPYPDTVWLYHCKLLHLTKAQYSSIRVQVLGQNYKDPATTEIKSHVTVTSKQSVIQLWIYDSK